MGGAGGGQRWTEMKKVDASGMEGQILCVEKNKRKNQKIGEEEKKSNHQQTQEEGERQRMYGKKQRKRGAGVKTWRMSRLVEVEEKDRKCRVGS